MKTNKSSRLLILNYVMDRSHPALAHQAEVVFSLSKYFDFITVITGNSNMKVSELPKNVEVVSTHWRENSNLRNVLVFYIKLVSAIRKNRFDSVFSHMALIQSFLVAPLLKFLRIKHYVWYAHAQNSLYLRLVYKFADNIVTSTQGSCPIQGNKVVYLGQSVDEKVFKNEIKIQTKTLNRGIHIGRLDPSKNIDKIIESIIECRKTYPSLSITFVGNPSGKKSEIYLLDIKKRWKNEIDSGHIIFNPAIPRSEIPIYLANFDFFVHGFVGSLDKTLVESTMCKLPVATLNVEYHNEFGLWPGCKIDLVNELNFILSADRTTLLHELERRRQIAIEKHSQEGWTERLSRILHNKYSSV